MWSEERHAESPFEVERHGTYNDPSKLPAEEVGKGEDVNSTYRKLVVLLFHSSALTRRPSIFVDAFSSAVS